MNDYYPPVLLVIKDDTIRTNLTIRVQESYEGAVYSEPTAQAALHSLSNLYDVGIVAAEDTAVTASGKHVLSIIQQVYPDIRRVLLLINDQGLLDQGLELLNSGEIHELVQNGIFPSNVIEMLRRQAPIRKELETKRIEVINQASQLNMVALSPSQLNMMLDMHLKNSNAPGTPNSIKKLARHIRSLWDTERRRLAADIHDDLGQKLTSIQLGVSALMYHDIPLSCLGELKLVEQQISEMHLSVRNILNGLRSESLETLGLVPALRQLCSNIEKVAHIKCKLVCPIDEVCLNDSDTQDNVYRIIQESLNNIVKHASAASAVVKLSCPLDGQFAQISIEDDGIGFNTEEANYAHGYGILGMRERAESFGGTLDITSQLGYGTKVNLRVPVVQQGV